MDFFLFFCDNQEVLNYRTTHTENFFFFEGHKLLVSHAVQINVTGRPNTTILNKLRRNYGRTGMSFP
jgi:hypothetical protein